MFALKSLVTRKTYGALILLGIVLSVILLNTPSASAATSPTIRYNILVKTGCLRNAGTDARVYINLKRPGYAVSRELDNPHRNDFEICSLDGFPMEIPAAFGDQVTSIDIWHNNSGSTPGWYLEWVEVQNQNTGQRWRFAANRWLSVSDWPYSLSILDMKPSP